PARSGSESPSRPRGRRPKRPPSRTRSPPLRPRRRGRARARSAGRSAGRMRVAGPRSGSWVDGQVAELGAGGLDLDQVRAGLVGGEGVGDLLAGLAREHDVVVVEMDLLGLVGV